MQKLYEKSRLSFALMWILLYVVGTSMADAASRAIGIEKLLTLPWLLLLSLYAALWLKKQGLTRSYGLCAPALPASGLLWYLPLVLLCTTNLWYGVTMNMPLPDTLLYIGSMACVGFLEELIFRGFLFKAMAENGLRAAVIVSSLTFGMGHIVNLFYGSGAELLTNLCQVIYAAAIGFAFVLLFLKTGSLYACIATHSIVNMLSAFANRGDLSPAHTVLSALFLTIVSLGYAWWLHRKA